jgi:hypothetical protein
VIASNEVDVSTVEIAPDLYTGSDHETLFWEINEIGNTRDTGGLRMMDTTRWNILQPLKNDDIDEEEKWRKDWMKRIHPDWGLDRVPPLNQIPILKDFSMIRLNRRDGHLELNAGGRRSSKRNGIFFSSGTKNITTSK